MYCSRKTALICKSVQLVKTQHHCDGLAAKRTATAWMCTPGRCSWDCLRPNRFSLHSGDLKSFLFWRLSIRYPSCIFHSRVFSAPIWSVLTKLGVTSDYIVYISGDLLIQWGSRHSRVHMAHAWWQDEFGGIYLHRSYVPAPLHCIIRYGYVNEKHCKILYVVLLSAVETSIPLPWRLAGSSALGYSFFNNHKFCRKAI